MRIVFPHRVSPHTNACCVPHTSFINGSLWLGTNQARRLRRFAVPNTVSFRENRCTLHGHDWRRKWTSNLPRALRKCVEQSDIAGVPVDSFKVYRLNHDEFFFEFHSSHELESAWIDSLNLQEVRREERYIQKFLLRIPHSHQSPESTFFSNSNRIAGDKGDQIVLMRFGKTDLYIGHYYNF